jgi:hypothetical protein
MEASSMRPMVVLSCTLALWGCSSGDTNGGSADGGKDASANDVTAPDVSTHETGTSDTGGPDTGTADTGSSDASDGGCPAAWLVAPQVDPSIAVPSDGGTLRIHAAASGTQNYACTATDAGTTWTFVGPEATLDDCTGALFGHHFASDGGAASPEWQATDGTYVVGHKVAAFTPDGGSGSVPWLLLQVVGQGGSGPLAQSLYVQRLDTDGGVAPGPGCDAGATQAVPYTADYYFYGP